MFGIQGTEWLLILLLVLLLFGGKRIPELARSFGKGISEFKKGVRDIEKEVELADQEKQAKTPESKQVDAQPFRFDPYSGKPAADTGKSSA